METPLQDITSGELSTEEKALVQATLKRLRRYVVLALGLVVVLVVAGIAIVIVQNIQFHSQLVHAASTTHGLLHQLQATLTQDKCEIINGPKAYCPLPK